MKTFYTLIIAFVCTLSFAQKNTTVFLKSIEDSQSNYESIAQEIWSYAEMGYQEERSSALLQKTLSEEGFSITAGVAEIPTAFVATYGTGGPVIAIFGRV